MDTMAAEPVPRSLQRYLRFSVRGLIVGVLLFGVWLGSIVRSARIQRDAVAAIRQAGGGVKYHWEWKSWEDTGSGNPRAPRWLVDRIGVDYFGHAVVAWLPEEAGAVLPVVGKLSQLEGLDLAGLRLTDEGLAHVKRLTKLTFLSVHGTQVTDVGLADLKALSKLSALDLGDTRVTDLGIDYLKGLNELSVLNLGSTKVSDAGLVHLTGLSKLSLLNLIDTDVTDTGIKQLKQTLPSLKIVH
jgi:Leucine-rich repeat (LRR) protein